ncbi:hypothetical protein DFQ28_001198 [Apophysomyces sp. BC1034]|nr:hypothetical protein DFQ29_000734 [Apophysomyces sp. BC1021]KAG0190945.1 hypothetical protein DFQ28_001198 [Apophysomyces sp. BC1034]
MTVVPIPMEEIPVLETLITIRHKLSALKKDRDSYPKPDLIIALYHETEEQVEKITDLRTNEVWNLSARNRVNDVLDDVMSLLSLFFMSIGRNQESPAVYAQLVTIERYLDQLAQMGIYTDSILIEIEDRLKDVEKIIFADADRPDVSRCFLDLLKKKLARCKMKLRHIDQYLPKDTSKGQALIVGLLEHLYEETHDLIASTDNISESLMPIADRLKDIKAQLERLALTHRWTLRETDLYTFQARLYAKLQLQEIEKLRQNGKFRDAQSNVPDGQALINFLLRGCYRLMSKMLSENVPVSEALMPVHNQLSTVRRCLVEVTKWGKPDSARDLYPYQMKLASIDNMRVNGIFYDDEGNIPEGQAICTALLNECYDILHDFMATIE